MATPNVSQRTATITYTNPITTLQVTAGLALRKVQKL